MTEKQLSIEGTKPLVPTSQKEVLEALYKGEADVIVKSEYMNFVLNQQPRKEWVKEHPYITGYKYLPIDKVEYLLAKIFKRYRIEIMREGTAFNGVYVVVRVHYLNIATGQMDYHDGIGACQLQTKKGSSPADLANINNGALGMAFPLAKSVAVKDACDHFGNIFGANLNRKDIMAFEMDKNINNYIV